ncbi:hypothetical protein FRC03_001539 [Tulasnella sp. 419]|nr:hypothetical protein FRC03_001539 [Tulasnella sp. 419]
MKFHYLTAVICCLVGVLAMPILPVQHEREILVLDSTKNSRSPLQLGKLQVGSPNYEEHLSKGGTLIPRYWSDKVMVPHSVVAAENTNKGRLRRIIKALGVSFKHVGGWIEDKTVGKMLDRIPIPIPRR